MTEKCLETFCSIDISRHNQLEREKEYSNQENGIIREQGDHLSDTEAVQRLIENLTKTESEF